jgi:hypothetical protein
MDVLAILILVAVAIWVAFWPLRWSRPPCRLMRPHRNRQFRLTCVCGSRED